MSNKTKYSVKLQNSIGSSVSSSSLIPDCLFGKEDLKRDTSEEPVLMSVDRLFPSPRNPYRVDRGPDDPWMTELCESIRKNGILSPIVVRPVNGTDQFEIISGHRRLHAAKRIELKEVPVIIRTLTDDEAAIQLVDYNLNREELLCSEKAYAYRLKYDAIRHSWGGNRKDDNQKSPGNSCSGNALEAIAAQIGISPASVRNYLNLTRLCEEFMEMVDEKEIPMKAGVQISYLRKDIQKLVWQNLENLSEPLNEQSAGRIRRFCEQKQNITKTDLIGFLSEIGSLQKKAITASQKQKTKTDSSCFRFTKSVQSRYFPADISSEEICDIIHSLLHEWAVSNNPNYKGG